MMRGRAIGGAGPVKLTQKALLFHKAEFDFGDRLLGYLVEDEKMRAGFAIPYESIPRDRALQTFREWTLWRFGALFWLAAIAALALFHSSAAALVWILLAPALALLVAARRMRFEATVIATPLGKLIVFDGAGKDAILAEIERRRATELKRKYADIDFVNDPRAEIAKYRWLKTEGAISQAEFDDAIARLAAVHRAPEAVP